MFRRVRLQQKQRLNRSRRRVFVDRQMLIIMLTSIFLFFAIQIPLNLFNILLSPVLQSRLSMTQAFNLTSIFEFIASINFAVRNFWRTIRDLYLIFILDNVLCSLFDKWIISTRILQY